MKRLGHFLRAAFPAISRKLGPLMFALSQKRDAPITQILAIEMPLPDVTVRATPHVRTGQTDWRNAMRSGLALCLLIALCASGNAAAREHHAKSRNVIVRSSQAVMPAYVTQRGVRVYRDASAPGGFRTDHDEPVSYNDRSKFGGTP